MPEIHPKYTDLRVSGAKKTSDFATSSRSHRVSPGLENDEGNGRRKQVADGAGRVHGRNRCAAMS